MATVTDITNQIISIKSPNGARPVASPTGPCGASGRPTANVIRPYLPFSAATIDALEKEITDAQALVDSLRPQAQVEAKAAAEQIKERLSHLETQSDKIRTWLDENRRDHTSVHERLEAEAAKSEAARGVRTKVVDQQIAAKRTQLQNHHAAVEARRKKLEGDQEQRDADADAAHAAAGYRFRTDDLFRHSEMTTATAGAECDMIVSAADRQPVPGPIGWGVTAVSGIAAGVSLGLAAKFLHSDTLAREVPIAALCSTFGIATSTALKFGLESLWAEVSRRIHRHRPWLAAAAVAVATTALVITTFSTVERRGLLAPLMVETVVKSVRGHAVVSSSQAQNTALFGSLFLTVPYCLFVSVGGYRKTRYALHSDRAEALLIREREAAEASLRSQQSVRDALKSHSAVRSVERRMEALGAKSDLTVRQIQDEITALEAARKSIMDETLAATAVALHLQQELKRLETERQQLLAELNSIENRKTEISRSVAALTPTVTSIQALEDKIRVAEARIAYEERLVCAQIQLMHGNLVQRLAAALRMRKPQTGTLTYTVKQD